MDILYSVAESQARSLCSCRSTMQEVHEENFFDAVEFLTDVHDQCASNTSGRDVLSVGLSKESVKFYFEGVKCTDWSFGADGVKATYTGTVTEWSQSRVTYVEAAAVNLFLLNLQGDLSPYRTVVLSDVVLDHFLRPFSHLTPKKEQSEMTRAERRAIQVIPSACPARMPARPIGLSRCRRRSARGKRPRRPREGSPPHLWSSSDEEARSLLSRRRATLLFRKHLPSFSAASGRSPRNH